MADNGEKEPLTPMQQAMADGKICAKCNLHNPVMIKQLQSKPAIIRSRAVQQVMILAVACTNSKSENFQRIITPQCSCSEFGVAPAVQVVKAPAGIANRMKG